MIENVISIAKYKPILANSRILCACIVLKNTIAGAFSFPKHWRKTTMKTLTATNQRVQFYLNFTTKKPTTSAKCKRLLALKTTLEEKNIMLDEMFPYKQLAVVDRIIYLTGGAGIAKVGADKLAEKCGVSKKTVTNAVKGLKETDEFIVARLIKTKGGAGKYIFVDKKHENFREIMNEVFLLSCKKIAQLNTEQFTEQDNTESIDALSLEDENKDSNINIFSLKQEKNIYISSNNTLDAIKESIEEEHQHSREYVQEYSSNPLQIKFYDLLDSLEYPKPINDVKHILALRVGSDCDMKRFIKAKNIIHSMAMRISVGYVFENVTASFTTALKKSELYNVVQEQHKPTYPKRSVAFYNWLIERE
jgi:predicted transcriptional regulator